MANEEEMEGFSISEQDLFYAHHPGQRPFRKATKNSQIYGIFNDSDDEEPSFSSKKTKKNDYTTPVGFVKGGVQGKPDSKEKSNARGNSDEEMDLEDEAVLEVLGVKEKGKQRGSVKAQHTRGKLFQQQPRRAFGSQDSHSSSQGSQGLGDWEKHTKGIGAKLLKQMGYQEGKGLGKSLQGRAAPIEAQVRKGRGAIGLYGAEHKNDAVITATSDDEKEDAAFRQKLGQWKKDTRPSEKTTKTKYVYRSSEQIYDEVTKDGVHKMAREYSEISKAKVIDMTGPEQRVLGGYTSLGARKTAEPDEVEGPTITKDRFHLEKLAYNLDSMVDFCEHEIVQNAKEMSYNLEQISGLETDVKNYRNKALKEESQIKVLTKVMGILEELEKNHESNVLELEFLTEQIEGLAKNYQEEYLTCNLANVGLVYLIPLMKQRLTHFWRPFDTNSTDEACRHVFQRLRPILEGYDPVSSRKFKMTSKDEGSHMDPYHGLLWHSWMPVFRSLVSQWVCKKAPPMVDLLDMWDPLLPKWIMDNIVDQLILPKIQKEVEAWNPLTDMVPIHAWIHPWLPRLDSKLELVYPTIRQKMAQALVAWSPADQSAKSVLLPWVPVFSKGAMDAFLIKNILPKLQEAVLRWEINPSRQELDVWNWLMNWKDLMPHHSLVQLLVVHFFPRWLQVLVAWLNHTPNYEEIVVWYTGWKSLFPPDFANHPSIQEQFTRALDIMNRSLAVGGQVELGPPPVAVIPPVVPPPPPPALLETSIPQGFRELVEYRCAQQGILCVPLVNRFHAGRPIFRVGNVHCYFDRQVVFAMVNDVWTPLTVQQLLDIAVQ